MLQMIAGRWGQRRGGVFVLMYHEDEGLYGKLQVTHIYMGCFA